MVDRSGVRFASAAPGAHGPAPGGHGAPDGEAKKGRIFNRGKKDPTEEPQRELGTKLGNLIEPQNAAEASRDVDFAPETVKDYKSFLREHAKILAKMNPDVLAHNAYAKVDREILQMLGVEPGTDMPSPDVLDQKITSLLETDSGKIAATVLMQHAEGAIFADQGIRTSITTSYEPNAAGVDDVGLGRGKGWLRKIGKGAVNVGAVVTVLPAAYIGIRKIDWRKAVHGEAGLVKTADQAFLREVQSNAELSEYLKAYTGIDPNDVRIVNGKSVSALPDGPAKRAMEVEMEAKRKTADGLVVTREKFFKDIGVDPSREPLVADANIQRQYNELRKTVDDQWGQDSVDECYLRADCTTGITVPGGGGNVDVRLQVMGEIYQLWATRNHIEKDELYASLSVADQATNFPPGTLTVNADINRDELYVYAEKMHREAQIRGEKPPELPIARRPTLANKIKAIGNIAEAELMQAHAINGKPAPTAEEIAQRRQQAIRESIGQHESNYFQEVPAVAKGSPASEIARYKAVLDANAQKEQEFARLRAEAERNVLSGLALEHTADAAGKAAGKKVETLRDETKAKVDKYQQEEQAAKDKLEGPIKKLRDAKEALAKTRKEGKDKFDIPENVDLADAADASLASGSDLVKAADKKELDIIATLTESAQGAKSEKLQADLEQLNQAQQREKAVEDAVRDLARRKRGVARGDLVTEAEGEILRLSTELRDPRNPALGLLPQLETLLSQTEDHVRTTARDAYITSLGMTPNAAQKREAEKRGQQAVDSHNDAIEKMRERINPRQTRINELDQSLDGVEAADVAYRRAEHEILVKAANTVDLAAGKKAHEAVVTADPASIQPHELRGLSQEALVKRLMGPPYNMPAATVEDRKKLLQTLSHAKAEQLALDEESRDLGRAGGREALGKILHDSEGKASGLGKPPVTTRELLTLTDDELNDFMHENYGWSNAPGDKAANLAVIHAAKGEALVEVRTRYGHSIKQQAENKLSDTQQEELATRRTQIQERNNTEARKSELQELKVKYQEKQSALTEAEKALQKEAQAERITISELHETYEWMVNTATLTTMGAARLSPDELRRMSIPEIKAEMKTRGYQVDPAKVAGKTPEEVEAYIDNIVLKAKGEREARFTEQSIDRSPGVNEVQYFDIVARVVPHPLTPEDLIYLPEGDVWKRLYDSAEYGWINDPAHEEANKLALSRAKEEAAKRLRIRYEAMQTVRQETAKMQRGEAETQLQTLQEVIDKSTPRGKLLGQMLDNFGDVAAKAPRIVMDQRGKYTDITPVNPANPEDKARFSTAELASGAPRGALEWMSTIFGCGKEGADRQACMSGALSVTTMDRVGQLLAEGLDLRDPGTGDHYATMGALLPVLGTTLGRTRSAKDVYEGVTKVTEGLLKAQR